MWQDELIGRDLDERYHVEAKLGAGGMGVVYLAQHRYLFDRVCVKVMRPELAEVASFVRRFIHEARKGHALSHPGIVHVVDFYEATIDVGSGDPRRAHCLIMEYVRGVDLVDLIYDEGHTPVVPPMEHPRVLALFRQIADAVGAVHGAGMVHRDLKPENVRVYRDEDGSERIKLLDFGLAAWLAAEAPRKSMVFRGGEEDHDGTPPYMSPEHWDLPRLDHRSDLYSLGVMLYEACTSTLPFDVGSVMAFMYHHTHVPPPRPSERRPDIDPELEELILQLLAKDPDDRPASAAELVRRLASIEKRLRAGAAKKAGETSGTRVAANLEETAKKGLIADAYYIGRALAPPDSPVVVRCGMRLRDLMAYERAAEVFERHVGATEEREHDGPARKARGDALVQLALCLGRLGGPGALERAEALLNQADREGAEEAWALQGRLWKDRWQLAWRLGVAGLDPRMARYRDACDRLRRSIAAYHEAFNKQGMNYYPGINVLTLLAAEEHLESTSRGPTIERRDPEERARLRQRVSEGVRGSLAERRAAGEAWERYWIEATEMELMLHDPSASPRDIRAKAREAAAGAPNRFQLDSTAQQLGFLVELGVVRERAAAALEAYRDELARRRAAIHPVWTLAMGAAAVLAADPETVAARIRDNIAVGGSCEVWLPLVSTDISALLRACRAAGGKTIGLVTDEEAAVAVSAETRGLLDELRVASEVFGPGSADEPLAVDLDLWARSAAESNPEGRGHFIG